MTNKGLENLQKRLDKKAKDIESRGNRLRLSDGDVASIRILQEAADFFVPSVHPVQDVSAKGKTFWRRFVCEGDGCRWCQKGLDVTERIYVWVWVSYILHKSPQDGKEWERVKNRAGATFYKEMIGAPRVLETGIGKSRYIAMKFINMNAEYGTLIDRDYNWLRTGSGKEDTAYDLIPTNLRKFYQEVPELKDLEELIKSESSSMTASKIINEEEIGSEDSGELF